MKQKQLFKQCYLNLTKFKWVVGIADFDKEVVFNPEKKLKIHWIKNTPRRSWFADPFILKETDNHIHLLVEELFYANNKGRISKLIVNRHNWRLEQIEPVIDISTHLSFPAYYRENGMVYVYPESTKTGKLTLYEYDEMSGEAKAIKDLCNYPVADAVLCSFGNKNYIIGTTSPKDNGKILDFYPIGDSSKGPEKSISFRTNVARNAGFPFYVNDRLIRPAQDCTKSYGSCVVLQEMIFTNDSTEFKEIRRLYSPLFKYREAFHTFNVFEGKLVAVDAEGFRYGLLAQLVYHIREFFRR